MSSGLGLSPKELGELRMHSKSTVQFTSATNNKRHIIFI